MAIRVGSLSTLLFFSNSFSTLVSATSTNEHPLFPRAKPLKTKLDKIVVGSAVGGFFGLLFLIMVIGLLWGRHISRRNARKDARIEEAGLSGNHKSSAEGRIPLMTRSQSPGPEEPKPTYAPFTTLMSSTVGVLDRLHGEPKKTGGR
jgi:hypothetical protein